MIIIVYFFTLGDDLSLNNNIEPKTNKQEESSKSINIVANTEQPKSISKKEEVVSKETTTPSNVEKTLIYKSSNDDKTYILNLYSNIKIEEENRKVVKYLPIKVFLKKDEIKQKLSISVQDSYKENSSVELSLELYSLRDNTTLSCDASFLKDLDFGYLYYLNIDIFDTTMSCYIDKKKKLPKMIDDNLEIKMEHLSKERQEYLSNEKNKIK